MNGGREGGGKVVVGWRKEGREGGKEGSTISAQLPLLQKVHSGFISS